MQLTRRGIFPSLWAWVLAPKVAWAWTHGGGSDLTDLQGNVFFTLSGSQPLTTIK